MFEVVIGIIIKVAIVLGLGAVALKHAGRWADRA